jgi:hypothetical protein
MLRKAALRSTDYPVSKRFEENEVNTLDLLKVNVNDHTEKKNGLTYLSWAWAWQEALKADPSANWNVKMFGDQPLVKIGETAMVFVEVTMLGKTMTCQLPVLDHRNKAIANPDAFQVNTAIMRCLAKCIGLHGLGLYIYAGEDLPEADTPEVTDYVKLIEESKNVEELKKNFASAFAAAKSNAGAIAEITVAKDKRKSELAA